MGYGIQVDARYKRWVLFVRFTAVASLETRSKQSLPLTDKEVFSPWRKALLPSWRALPPRTAAGRSPVIIRRAERICMRYVCVFCHRVYQYVIWAPIYTFRYTSWGHQPGSDWRKANTGEPVFRYFVCDRDKKQINEQIVGCARIFESSSRCLNAHNNRYPQGKLALRCPYLYTRVSSVAANR